MLTNSNWPSNSKTLGRFWHFTMILHGVFLHHITYLSLLASFLIDFDSRENFELVRLEIVTMCNILGLFVSFFSQILLFQYVSSRLKAFHGCSHEFPTFLYQWNWFGALIPWLAEQISNKLNGIPKLSLFSIHVFYENSSFLLWKVLFCEEYAIKTQKVNFNWKSLQAECIELL